MARWLEAWREARRSGVSDDPAFLALNDTQKRFAIPDALYQEGVRRYGFHGLSYTYIAGAMKQQAPEIAAGKVVAAIRGVRRRCMCRTG